MKPLRVLVLMHEGLVPPASLEGYSDRQIEEFKAESDVMACLEKAGHTVRALGLGDNLGELRAAIADWKPNVAFNLLEEFQGIATYDQYVVAFLELMKQPYTGCNPRGLLISRDKALSKQLLTYHRVPTPRFMVFRRGQRYRAPRKLAFPLFVKSVTDDASFGISQASIVGDAERLKERVEFIHQQTGAHALVEEYVEGRELYVGVIGNDRLRTLPVWEMDFGTLPDVMAGIATRKVKWDRRYQQKHGIRTGPAQSLPDGCAAYLDKLSKRIYRALSLSGYARLDFRMRNDGSVFVLEANANPNISHREDFADSAEAGGVEYAALLEHILRLGRNYHAAWRIDEG
ncbi:MAG TPA: D-alanine--D-alanine ligase [Thermoanaerobaculia bacterium]|nr:D-alanine--D-alanine ligase [Thermoanaerobaculia bacterium]